MRLDIKKRDETGTRRDEEGVIWCGCGRKLVEENKVKCRRCGKEHDLEELIVVAGNSKVARP